VHSNLGLAVATIHALFKGLTKLNLQKSFVTFFSFAGKKSSGKLSFAGAFQNAFHRNTFHRIGNIFSALFADCLLGINEQRITQFFYKFHKLEYLFH